MNKMFDIFKNRWFRFIATTVIYLLLFVVWTGNLWLLVGVAGLFDLFISRLFYKYVWRHNDALRARNKLYNSLYDWISAVVFATVLATLIHLFVFQLYVIPSSSMEKSLLVGDYLYVSKIAYGPQVPNTPLSFPFVHNTMPFSDSKPSFSERIKWQYHRLRGLGSIQRYDAVVFNFPAGDTVLLENQAVTYYDVLRQYQTTFGNEEGRRRLNADYTVVSRPVDKRENYIKRCVGVSGDTIQIIDSQLYVNGERAEDFDGRQFIYTVETSSPLTRYAIENLGITEYSGSGSYYYMTLTDRQAEQLGQMKEVLSVKQYVATEPNSDIFPSDSLYHWTQDNFGPLWVPAKGTTIQLNTSNLPLYRRIIEVYEGNTLRVEEDKIYINGEPADSYTFRMNYYWLMGDNRHNSADSRFWGFVPEDHVVGKASLIIFSKDSAKGGIRWNRIFKRIK